MHEADLQNLAADLVRRNVLYCVSELVSRLYGLREFSECDDLVNVMSQVNYEDPARHVGWVAHEGAVRRPVQNQSGHWLNAPDWEGACEIDELSPSYDEAYEHWIVGGWFAEKLKEHGEMVIEDFLGLTIWGRCTTGQSISMDHVVREITRELNA